MALFLLENRDFLGFRMIFKVWLNQIFSNWTVNMKYTIIQLNLYFMAYSIVLKFEKIWLSHTLNIIRKPKKSLFYKTQEFSAGPSEFLPDLHFLCKIVLMPSNVIPLLLF
jgi:hypothetical protein